MTLSPDTPSRSRDRSAMSRLGRDAAAASQRCGNAVDGDDAELRASRGLLGQRQKADLGLRRSADSRRGRPASSDAAGRAARSPRGAPVQAAEQQSRSGSARGREACGSRGHGPSDTRGGSGAAPSAPMRRYCRSDREPRAPPHAGSRTRGCARCRRRRAARRRARRSRPAGSRRRRSRRDRRRRRCPAPRRTPAGAAQRRSRCSQASVANFTLILAGEKRRERVRRSCAATLRLVGRKRRAGAAFAAAGLDVARSAGRRRAASAPAGRRIRA